MKPLKLFFLITMLMALAIFALSATPLDNGDIYDSTPSDEDSDHDFPWPDQSQETTSLRGTSRFLAQKMTRPAMTCNNFPRVCRAKGSPGPDCCKKRCVNVMTDNLNCGMCGNKCEYPKICCKGKCVNPKSNKNHCGACNNKCKKGTACVFGMCSYA